MYCQACLHYENDTCPVEGGPKRNQDDLWGPFCKEFTNLPGAESAETYLATKCIACVELGTACPGASGGPFTEVNCTGGHSLRWGEKRAYYAYGQHAYREKRWTDERPECIHYDAGKDKCALYNGLCFGARECRYEVTPEEDKKMRELAAVKREQKE